MAIVYPVFPTNENEGLSGLAQIERISFSFRRDLIIDQFDDGMFEASRARGSARMVDSIVDTYSLREDDYDAVMSFLESVEFGNRPFLYFHPYIGETLVKYAAAVVPVDVLVQGNPAWFRLELKFRGVAA